ncbi:MAG TPA: ribose-5-phosphate isomerase A, partial [Thermoleophilaceae bacterium]|nr:ribose-5-phosphate isomerase A [Thermoleophilaceae bacterium]
KKVDRLGVGFRLPVEVVQFGWRDTRRRLASLLPDAELRSTEGGSEPYVTDEGHYILDAQIPAGTEPAALADALHRVPGVVEHGLFLDMAELALLGRPDGTVERLERP